MYIDAVQIGGHCLATVAAAIEARLARFLCKKYIDTYRIHIQYFQYAMRAFIPIYMEMINYRM